MGWFENHPSFFGVGWGGLKTTPKFLGWGGVVLRESMKMMGWYRGGVVGVVFFSKLSSSFTLEKARSCIYMTTQTLVSLMSLK